MVFARECDTIVEERLRDDAENGKLSIPFPNPSETPSLKMMESGTYRTITGNADKEHQQYVHSLKQANLKVVWIALSEDDQQLCFIQKIIM